MELGRFGHEVYKASPDPQNAFLESIRFLKSLPQNVVVVLVVGRGSVSPSDFLSPIPQDELQRTALIPVDYFGGSFPRPSDSHTPSLHLWMDFNDPSALSQIPDASVHRIIIDWSTWRYMKPLKPIGNTQSLVMDEWRRILNTGGELWFEGTVSSVCVGNSSEQAIIMWDFFNPSHITIPRNLVMDAGIELPLNPIGGTRRKILKAPRSPEANLELCQSERERLLANRFLATLDKITETSFIERGWSKAVVLDAQFPLRSNGWVERWWKIVK